MRYAPLRFSGFAERWKRRRLERETKACSLVRSPLEAHPRREEFLPDPIHAPLPLIVRQRWIAGLRGKSKLGALPTRSTRSIHFRIRSSPMDLFRIYLVSSRRIEVLFTYSCHWNVNCLSENHVRSACCPATILLRGSNSTPPIVEKARTRGNWRAGLGAAGCRLTWAYARSSTLAALYARTIHAFREMSPSTARNE